MDFNDWKPEYEYFQFFGQAWNIKKAKELLIQTPHEVNLVDIKPFTKLLQKVNEKTQTLTLGVYVDVNEIEKNPAQFDLSVPIIIIKHEIIQHLIIDGWHRVARAEMEQKKELPFVILSDEETKKVKFKGRGL